MRLLNTLTMCILFFPVYLIANEIDQANDTKYETPIFFANYACFKSNDAQTYIEIYSKVNFLLLEKKKLKGDFFVEYDLNFIIRDTETELKNLLFEDNVKLDTQITNNLDHVRVSVQSVFLSPGYYDCLITLTDKVSNKSYHTTMLLDVPDFPANQFSISDIELAHSITPAKNIDNAFVKYGYFIKPNVTRVLDFFTAEFYFYYEIYNAFENEAQADDIFNVKYRIRNETGAILKEIENRLTLPNANCAHTAKMAVLELPRGSYQLEIALKNERTKQEAVTRTPFGIGWSDLLSENENLDDLIDQLTYVAPKWNFETMKRMTNQQKRMAILSFWNGRDPSPETIENELMQEFYQRVSAANASFKHSSGKGWRSDRGKVYVQHGKPSTVKRMVQDGTRNRYEVWYYDKLRTQFIFVDDGGFGYFHLLPQSALAYHELSRY